MINELEKKIINLIQGDLPVTHRPFALLAEQLGISETELLAEIRKLKDSGVIRRFGATLRHQEAGYRQIQRGNPLLPAGTTKGLALQSLFHGTRCK